VAVGRKEVGTIVVLSPKGNFFGDTETDELQQAILDAATSGNERLVLNLRDCHALNSNAIGALMRGCANYRGRGGEIKLCEQGLRVHELFAMTGLDKVFDVYDTEEAALAAFAAGATGKTSSG
jgi:anti-sigma B factor antagonist